MSHQEPGKTEDLHHVEEAIGIGEAPPHSNAKLPLDWSLWRRNLLLSSLCLTSFAGLNAVLANAAGVVVQAKSYGKTAEDMTYSLSAALGGSLVGPFLWQIFSRRFGKPSAIFWASILLWATDIWAAVCTGRDDYASFVASRAVCGVAASASGFLSGSIVVDIYRLESRGKAFAMWSFSLNLGTILSPVLSGYIAEYSTWPVYYWYNLALGILVSIVLFVFLEETQPAYPARKHVDLDEENWLRRRLYLLPGAKSSRYEFSASIARKTVIAPWRILLCPHGFIAAFGLFVYYGFAAGTNNVFAVFLQTPKTYGGYGLSPAKNSNFLFSQWVGIAFATMYSTFLGDRLPLYLCKRNGGVWKPEYRLAPLWLPCLVLLPLGYILSGLGLANHWNLALVGFGMVSSTTGAVMVLSPLLAYLSECFLDYGSEANILGIIARLSWGLALPFFIFKWEAATGLKWMFGMIAIFHWVYFIPIVVLSIKGDRVRKYASGWHGARREQWSMSDTRSTACNVTCTSSDIPSPMKPMGLKLTQDRLLRNWYRGKLRGCPGNCQGVNLQSINP